MRVASFLHFWSPRSEMNVACFVAAGAHDSKAFGSPQTPCMYTMTWALWKGPIATSIGMVARHRQTYRRRGFLVRAVRAVLGAVLGEHVTRDEQCAKR